MSHKLKPKKTLKESSRPSVSDAQASEDRLQLSEEQFRVTLASIGDAVIATDPLGRVTFMNGIAEELTGWRQEEVGGKPLQPIFTIVNEVTRKPVQNPVDHVLREGKIVGLANHTVLIAKDGTERPIDDSGAPIRSADGRLLGVVLVFRDVTERRTAELTMLRLAAIVDSADDAIIGKNLKGIITSWNPGAERLFGYSESEMIGRSIMTLLPPDRIDEERHILERLQRGERLTHFETVRVTKDGRKIQLSLSISPIKDSEGNVVGASKIARDITEQKTAQKALEAAREQLQAHVDNLEERVRERTARLEETVGELEAFSYSLSHDLRAPLRAIQSFSQIVLSDCGPALGDENMTYLQKVVRASERMDRLIQDVLSLAQLSRQEIKVEPIDVERLVSDILQERPEFQPQKAEIRVDSPLLRMMGHDASFIQCLTNLLDNAVKFVAPGVKPRVRIYTERANSAVRLWIEDNGIGIDLEDEKRLFAMFQRLPTSQNYRGTGVGLAIVRKAAERMGGKVGLDSSLGRGSRFWLQLPEPKAEAGLMQMRQ